MQYHGEQYSIYFGRGHYEEHSCEIILKDQWFRRRCRLKKSLRTTDGRTMDVEPSAQVC